jgi:hypothetical protein
MFLDFILLLMVSPSFLQRIHHSKFEPIIFLEHRYRKYFAAIVAGFGEIGERLEAKDLTLKNV